MVSSIISSSVSDLQVFKREYEIFSVTQREASRIVEQFLAPPIEVEERLSIPFMPSVIMLNYLTDGRHSLRSRYPNPALTYLQLLRKWAINFFSNMYVVPERSLLQIQAKLCPDNQLENLSLRGGYTLVIRMIEAFAATIRGNESHKERDSCLRYAIWMQDSELLKEMLKNAEYSVNTVNSDDVPLLANQLSTEGSLEITRLLLDHGAEVNKVYNCGRTPLICAAEEGDLPAVSLLLEAGAKADYKDYQQETILTRVLYSTSIRKKDHKVIIEIFKKLIAAGANVNQQSSVGTTLMLALYNQHHEIANYLVSISNRDTINIVNRRGNSALHYAAMRCPSMVAPIAKLANVNLRSEEGKTALFYAIAGARKKDEAIISLLKAKADPSIRDDRGLTPLDYLNDIAERKRIEELIKKIESE